MIIPKRPREELKRVKKLNPNHKTKKESSQDDPKTVLDPPRGRNAELYLTPRGSVGRPNGTKTNPKMIKIEAKIQEAEHNDPRRS